MAPSLDAPMLITGFPGFLSDHLLRRLLRTTEAPIHLLVLPSTLDAAQERLDDLAYHDHQVADRCTLHPGDITDPRLGLDSDTYGELAESISSVWHLAAIYDLAVDEDIAYRVNVQGTIHVLDFCQACTSLDKLNYISTCYVAGKRGGQVLETELDLGQRHNNHYESTKFWAEVEVQRRQDQIPTTIFRPSIVVGHSRTGEINKYDGPYYVFQLLHRLPDWLPFPKIGRGDTPANLVPVDFVTDALVELGLRTDTTDQVFQLADPTPMTSADVVDHILEAFGRRPTMGRLPLSWVMRALENESVEAWTGLPRESLVYFHHDAQFDTANTDRALADTSIMCPPLPVYLSTLLNFFLDHPDQAPSLHDLSHSGGQDGDDGAPSTPRF